MPYDDVIDRLAARQHGIVCRAGLLELGIPNHAIDARIASGRLRRLHRGVFLVRGGRLSWQARLVAALRGAGPRAVASHRAAASLLGLPGVEEAVELTVVASRTPRLRGAYVHRTQHLPGGDVERRDGIRRTRVARTLIDLAAVLEPVQLEEAVDGALSRLLVTRSYLLRRLDAGGRQGRKGVCRLREVLARRPETRPRYQSNFERRLFDVLCQAGLPLPIPQYPVQLPDGRTVLLDFAYPEERLALEADSYVHHSSRRDWARDHTRNRYLTAMGWRILPVVWEDVTAKSGQLIDLVCRALVPTERFELSLTTT